jgi:uncharacterized RDD family membrane protein YckC
MLYLFGGTPGKLIVGIRIRKISGEKAGFKEIFLRSIVDMVLGLLSIALYYYPRWHDSISVIYQAWMWGEMLVLLTNKKKRAIHDFIANTVVIHMPFSFSEIKALFYPRTGFNNIN